MKIGNITGMIRSANTRRNRKRWLALLSAVILLVTTNGGLWPVGAWAEDVPMYEIGDFDDVLPEDDVMPEDDGEAAIIDALPDEDEDDELIVKAADVEAMGEETTLDLSESADAPDEIDAPEEIDEPADAEALESAIDLRDHLDDVQLIADDAGDVWQVVPDEPYILRLSFSRREGQDFDAQALRYALPEGVRAVAESGDIEGVYGRYEVEDGGLLTVYGVFEGEDAFSLDLLARFENAGVIDFGGGISREVAFPVEEETEPEIEYPAQSFEDATRYVAVSVTAEAGAFPAGTTMTLRDVVDTETIDGITEKVEEDFVKVERVHAVDITFTDADGNEIEPLLPISVVMTVREFDAEQEAMVVHVDDDGEAQVLEDAEPTGDDSSVEFTAEAFSVYAVVVTQKIETKVIVDGGDTYRVEVTYAENANIPAGAALSVTEVTADARYLEEVKENIDQKIALARFFDIKIVDEGGAAVSVDAPVEVKVWLDDEAPEADASLMAVHFAEDGIETVQAREAEDTVVFKAESFSVYGVVYTVDFDYYGYTHALAMEKSIKLSDLLKVIKAEEDGITVGKIESVTWTNEALTIAETEGDWTLTAKQKLDGPTTLTLKMKDGTVADVEITVFSQRETITDMLTSVNIYQVDNTEESIGGSGSPATLRTNKAYDVTFTFAETPTEQFRDDGEWMIFQLPEEVTLDDSEGEVPFTVDLGNGKKVEGNIAKVVDGGKAVQIKWNSESENFEELTASPRATITLRYRMQLEKDTQLITFNETTDVVVIKDESFDVTLTKDAEGPDENGRVKYTVTVTADGDAKNIKVSDAMKGTALSYVGPMDIKIGDAVVDDLSEYNIQSNEDGFNLTIPSLNNGETATLTYYGQIDFDKLTPYEKRKEDVTLTRKDTLNTVTATDSNPEPQEAEHFFEDDDLDYLDIKKEADGNIAPIKVDGKTMQPVRWKITYNSKLKLVSEAKLTDTLYGGPLNSISYYTDSEDFPFTVVATTQNGSETLDVGWENVDVTSFDYSYENQVTAVGQSWTWRTPRTSTPTMYEITYYTLVDPESIAMLEGGTPTFNNKVQEYQSGSSAGAGYTYSGGTINPTELKLKKKFTNFVTDEETHTRYARWEISFDRQEYDLVGAYLVDEFPVHDGYTEPVVIPSKEEASLRELLSDSGVQEDDLYPGEQFDEMGHEAGTNRVFWFYKDEARTQTGLSAWDKTHESPTVHIVLYTLVNETWVKNSVVSEDWPIDHLNKVTLYANNLSAEDSAICAPETLRVVKQAANAGKLYGIVNGSNGAALPVFKFTVTVSGLNELMEEDPTRKLTISDQFNTNVFCLLTKNETVVKYDDTGEPLSTENLDPIYLKPVRYRTGEKWDDIEMKAISVDDGVTFTADQQSKYAHAYELTYYLVMKEDARDTLAEALNNPGKEETDGGAIWTSYKAAFDNTATLNERQDPEDGANEAKYEIDLTPLKKTASPLDPNTDTVEYTIELNPMQLKLNDGNVYQMTDTYSNASVDFDTITVKTCVPAENRGKISWTFHSNKGTFWIPDETYVVITYKAWPVGQRGQNVTMENTAATGSYSGTTTSSVELSADHEGSAASYGIRVFKFGNDDMTNKLPGAVFQLYEQTASGPQRMKYGIRARSKADPDRDIINKWADREHWPDGVEENLPTRYNHNVDDYIYFVTDENGIADIKLSQRRDGVALDLYKQYYLVEVVAPTGYVAEKQKDGSPLYWNFIISDMDNFETSTYVYRDGGMMSVNNAAKPSGIVLRKAFTGSKAVTYDFQKNVSFRIVGRDNEGKVVFSKTVSYADFNNDYSNSDDPWRFMIEGKKLVPGEYTVTELNCTVPNHTLTATGGEGVATGEETEPTLNELQTDDGNPFVTFTITQNDLDTNQVFTVRFKNDYQPMPMDLEIKKEWDENVKDNAVSAEFTVYRNGAAYGDIVTLPDNNGKWTKTLTGLPRYDDNGKAIKWTVAETKVVYEPNGEVIGDDLKEYFTTTVTVNDGETAKKAGDAWSVVVPDDHNASVHFTNKLNELIDVTVKKEWVPSTDKLEQIVFDLYRTVKADDDITKAEKVRSGVVLATSEPEGVTFKMMAKFDGDHNIYRYFVVEHNAAGFTTECLEPVTSGKNMTLTIKNTPKGDVGTLKVTKQVVGLTDTTNKEYTFTVMNSKMYLHDDGTLSKERKEFKVGANGSIEFTNVLPGEYTVQEVISSDIQVEGRKLVTQIKVGQTSEANGATVTVGSGADVEATIVNKYVGETTTFQFGKLWLGPSGNVIRLLPWPDKASITVNIGRRTGDTVASDFELTYVIRKDEKGDLTATLTDSKIPEPVDALTMSISEDNLYNRFVFTLNGLPKGDWSYFATEASAAYAAGDDVYGCFPDENRKYGIINGLKAQIMEGKNEIAANEKATEAAINQVDFQNYSLKIPVKKLLAGWPDNSWPSGTFTFQLYDQQGKAINGKTVEIGTGGTGEIDVTHDISLTGMSWNASEQTFSGRYTFFVKEVVPEEENRVKGFTYDTQMHRVVVSVKYKWNNGELTYKVYGDGEEAEDVVEITNTYDPETVTVKVKKTWEDDSNRDGHRRDVQFRVHAWVEDATASETPVVIANSANLASLTGYKEVTTVWLQKKLSGGTLETEAINLDDKENYITVGTNNNTVTNHKTLPKYYHDQEIVYTVEEIMSEDVSRYYTASVVTYNENNEFEITNTHKIDTFDIGVSKEWIENLNTGVKPTEATLLLLANGHAAKDAEGNDVPSITIDHEHPTEQRWSNLPVNEGGKPISYTLSEEGIPLGYHLVFEPVKATEERDDDGHWKTGVNDYIDGSFAAKNVYELTDFTVTKDWKDDNNRDNLRPDEVTFKLQYSTDKKTWTDVGASAEINVDSAQQKASESSSWQVSWTGLPAWLHDKQVYYRAVETVVPDGYSYDGDPTDPALTGTHMYSITQDVTNRHTPNVTDLSFTKVWNHDGLTEGVPTTTDFRQKLHLWAKVKDSVAGASAENYKTPFEVANTDDSIAPNWRTKATVNGSAPGDYTVTIHDLPANLRGYVGWALEYYVTEDAMDNYSADVSQVKNGGTLTNTRDTGSLTLSKKLVSSLAADEKLYTFTITAKPRIADTYGDVTFTDGKATVTLEAKHDQTVSKTIEGLPAGVQYTVTEEPLENITTTGNNVTQTLGASGVTFDFTNTRDTGSLEIKKTVVSGVKEDHDQEFNFEVTLNGLNADEDLWTFKAQKYLGDEAQGVEFDATFDDESKWNTTLKHNESVKLLGLPTDATYEVVEETLDNFATESDHASGTIATADNTATFTNTRKTGSLTLRKAFSNQTGGAADVDATQPFTFRVTLTPETGKTLDLANAPRVMFKAGDDAAQPLNFTENVAEVTVSVNRPVTITGIPVGTRYAVEEILGSGQKYDIEGYENSEGTIALNHPVVEVTATNRRHTGSLAIHKSVESDLEADADRPFTFTITADKALSKDTYAASLNGVDQSVRFSDDWSATVTLKKDQTLVIRDLPTDVKFTVTETEDAVFDVKSAIDDDDLTTGRSVVATIAAKDATVTAEFKNTRNAMPLSVEKTVVSDVASDHTHAFRFEVKVTGLTDAAQAKLYQAKIGDADLYVRFAADGAASIYDNAEGTGNPVTRFELKDGQQLVIDDIPVGAAYAVLEDWSDEPGYQANFKAEVSTNTPGTVSAQNINAVTFTNERATGGLKLAKAVISPFSAEQTGLYAFTVTVRMPEGEYLGDELIYTEGTTARTVEVDENGVATIHVDVAGGGEATLTGLPAGALWTVVEDDHTAPGDAGYVVTRLGDTALFETTYVCDEDEYPANTQMSVVANATSGIAVTNRRAVLPITLKKISSARALTAAGLEGAEFTLRPEGEGDAWTVALKSATNGMFELSDEQTLPEGVSVDGATVRLPVGTYTLTETEAPDGYISMTEPVTITVAPDGVTYRAILYGEEEPWTHCDDGQGCKINDTDATIDLLIPNTPGDEFPEAGGPGTAAYAALGTLLTLLAAVLLIFKRRSE